MSQIIQIHINFAICYFISGFLLRDAKKHITLTLLWFVHFNQGLPVDYLLHFLYFIEFHIFNFFVLHLTFNLHKKLPT